VPKIIEGNAVIPVDNVQEARRSLTRRKYRLVRYQQIVDSGPVQTIEIWEPEGGSDAQE
jgi:hypothetical protein